MGLSISTSWNSFRHSSAVDIIDEVKKIGFDTVELNFSLTSGIVQEMAALVEDRKISVSSLHNFCPIPDGLSVKEALPDCFSLASLDEGMRERAVRQTRISIDTAKKLNAKALVLHVGRVEIEDKTRDLIKLYNKGLKDTAEYLDLQTHIVQERQEKASAHFNQTLKSLQEVSDYAVKLGILLGVETRFYFREIPSLSEIEVILDRFKDRNVFYWHDTGHAQIHEILGFSKHTDFLDSYSDRMIGIHLHDVSGAADHRAPSKGEFDFSILKRYIRKDTIKVIESHQPATAQDIKDAKVYLENIFNDLL